MKMKDEWDRWIRWRIEEEERDEDKLLRQINKSEKNVKEVGVR